MIMKILRGKSKKIIGLLGADCSKSIKYENHSEETVLFVLFLRV